MTEPKLLTTGNIALKLDCHRDTVSYLISRLKIQPEYVAGTTRLFSNEHMEEIRRAFDNRRKRKPKYE